MRDSTKFRAGVVAAMAAVVVWYTCGVTALMGPTALADPPPATATATAAPDARPADAKPADARPANTWPTDGSGEAPSRRDRDPPAVAIIVPSVFFMTVLGIVLAGFYASYRREKQRHETLRAVIEKGGEIPHELLAPPGKRPSDLRRGVVLLSGGLGLSILLAAVPAERGVWTAGLIPVLLGLGYLLVWKLEPPPASPSGDRTPRDYRS